MDESKIIEMVTSLCEGKNAFSGILNLDLSVCYFSKDLYLKHFGDEVFKQIRIIGKERELTQIKKNHHILELFRHLQIAFTIL